MRLTPTYLLRVAGWLLIGAVTLELGARSEDALRYGAPFFGNYDLDTLYENDALGTYGRPNASYLGWHLNEVGYRGPALRQGTYRIACIGSSETFGLYEGAGREWPRQLEAALNQGGPQPAYEVVNVAYPGMALATSLKRLPQVLAVVHPRMVVIYPSYTPYITLTNAHPDPKPHPRESGGFRLRLGPRLNTLFKGSLPERLQHWLRARQLAYQAKNMEVLDRLPPANVERFRDDLLKLVDELKRQGVSVVLVTHADRFGQRLQPGDVLPADREYLTDWRKFFPELSEAGLLDMEARMSAEVRLAGAREGVPVVDAAHGIQPGAASFSEFVHFTADGADALGREIAPVVLAQAQGGTGRSAEAASRP